MIKGARLIQKLRRGLAKQSPAGEERKFVPPGCTARLTFATSHRNKRGSDTRSIPEWSQNSPNLTKNSCKELHPESPRTTRQKQVWEKSQNVLKCALACTRCVFRRITCSILQARKMQKKLKIDYQNHVWIDKGLEEETSRKIEKTLQNWTQDQAQAAQRETPLIGGTGSQICPRPLWCLYIRLYMHIYLCIYVFIYMLICLFVHIVIPITLNLIM